MKENDELAVAATLSHLRQQTHTDSQDMPDREGDHSLRRTPTDTSATLDSPDHHYAHASIPISDQSSMSSVDGSIGDKPPQDLRLGFHSVPVPETETQPNGNEPALSNEPPTNQPRSPPQQTDTDHTTRDPPGPCETETPATSQRPWASVLLTATSFVLTKDARKKVRQVLSLLRLASEHLNGKVNALKVAMEEDADHDNVTPKISRVAIRNDIISTIKKCVAMFSTLATNSLPSVARARVRNTILRLPAKWASQFDEASGQYDRKSESAVLALATETLIAIQNITNILSESMDRADSWVEKLPSFRLGKRPRPEEDGDTSEDPALTADAAAAKTKRHSQLVLEDDTMTDGSPFPHTLEASDEKHRSHDQSDGARTGLSGSRNPA